MNCTVCKKPIEEHGEGRETDRCVAEKLGWNEVVSHHKGAGKAHGYQNCSACFNLIPHYSSPTMSAETWGLVETMGWFQIDNRDSVWCIYYAMTSSEPYMLIQRCKTPTLAICRAFLAKENPCTK